MASEARIQSVGRRKLSVARVLLRRGSGKWSVNGRELTDYFPRPTHQIRIAEPLKVTPPNGGSNVIHLDPAAAIEGLRSRWLARQLRYHRRNAAVMTAMMTRIADVGGDPGGSPKPKIRTSVPAAPHAPRPTPPARTPMKMKMTTTSASSQNLRSTV